MRSFGGSARKARIALVGKQRCDIATATRPPGARTRPRSVKTSIGLHQILHRHGDHGAVEGVVRKGEHRLLVQVVNDAIT